MIATCRCGHRHLPGMTHCITCGLPVPQDAPPAASADPPQRRRPPAAGGAQTPEAHHA